MTAKKTAAYFHATNRGKSSVCIDFRTPEGQAQVKDLVRDADVLIENFKVEGLMSVTGDPSGHPEKIGVALVDVITGVYASTAILAALHQRDQTGVGQLSNQSMNFFSTGESPTRIGNSHPNLVPYQTFACSDGHIIIAVGNDGQFTQFCHLLSVPELAEDTDYASNEVRVKNRTSLGPLLENQTLKMTKEELLGTCEEYGVPAGPINSIEEVFDDPQVVHRGLRIQPDGIPGVRTPITFSKSKLNLKNASPTLGKTKKPK